MCSVCVRLFVCVYVLEKKRKKERMEESKEKNQRWYNTWYDVIRVCVCTIKRHTQKNQRGGGWPIEKAQLQFGPRGVGTGTDGRYPMENGVYPVVTEPIYDGHCDIVTIVSNTRTHTHTKKRGENKCTSSLYRSRPPVHLSLSFFGPLCVFVFVR